MKTLRLLAIALLSLTVFIQCGSSSSSSDTNSTATALTSSEKITAHKAISASISSLFGRSSSSTSSLIRYATTSCDSNDPGCTCDSIRTGSTPIFVTATPFASAASYGEANDQVSLVATDFCNDSSGNETSGSGTDGLGLYGAFTIRSDTTSSCTGSSSSSVTIKNSSSGVFRNDSSGNLNLYGSFTIDVSGSQSTLNCTIILDSNETVTSAECTDSSNATIVSDSSQSCSLSQTALQETVGVCDMMGNPDLSIYDVSTTSTSAERTYIEGEIDNYENEVTLMRPHRVNGHVFSYNIVDTNADGTYDWSKPDDVVTTTQNKSMKLFINIYPEADDGDFDSDAEDYAVKITELPSNTSGYSAFVQAMVERYDGDGYNDMPDLEIPIKYWAAGNEPYCDSADTSCHADILSLLELTYDAVKAADPDAVVLSPGAAPLYDPDGNPNSDVETLYQHIFDNGGLNYMDKLAFHTAVGRANPSVETYVIKYNSMMGSSGVPMWLTETGSRDVDGTTVFDSDATTEWGLFETYIDAALAFDDIEKVFVCNFNALYNDSTYWALFDAYLDTL